jgi:hypothetical protein
MRLLDRTLGALPRRLFVDRGDYRRTVLLAGTGRSGTTWLGALVNFDHSFRPMFEPFHAGKIARIRHWRHRQYLRPDETDARYLGPATAILSGAIRHPWIDRDNRRFVARTRLIKDIRVSLLLKWIKRRFPEIPQLLLLRHPCAVAHSKLRLRWDTHLDVFLDQPELVTDFLGPFVDVLRGTEDPFERHVLMWCVENYVPLQQFARGELLVVFYEDLCVHPEPELRRILGFLGRTYSESILDAVSRPSALSRGDSPIRTGGDPVSSWRADIGPGQVSRARELCRLFGLDALYGDQDVPQIAGDEVLSRAPARG